MRLGRFVLAFHMLVVSRAAAADPLPRPVTSARLVYTRDASAETCPDEAALRAAVRERVGFDPFDAAATRVISCRIEKIRHMLRARIDVVDGTGQPANARELVSKHADCQELAEAVALTLTIAINPLILAERTSPERLPAPTSAVAPMSPAHLAPVSPAVSVPLATAPPRSFHLRVGARADTAAGLDPGLAYGGTLHLGIQRRQLSAGLEFRVLAPSSLAMGRGSIHVWQWAVLLAPCAHRGGFLACLVGSAGMVHGRGEGYAVNEQSSSPTAAAGLRGGWEYPLLGDRLRLAVTLDVLAAMTRTHFSLGGADAWTTQPVGAALGVGAQSALF
jgi:hypothetical protein